MATSPKMDIQANFLEEVTSELSVRSRKLNKDKEDV